VRGSASACDDGELYEAGPRIPEPFVRRDQGCVALHPSAAFFAVGPKVSPESFPAGTLRVVAGPGRLRPLAIDGRWG
jgi:hypothetical protein